MNRQWIRCYIILRQLIMVQVAILLAVFLFPFGQISWLLSSYLLLHVCVLGCLQWWVDIPSPWWQVPVCSTSFWWGTLARLPGENCEASDISDGVVYDLDPWCWKAVYSGGHDETATVYQGAGEETATRAVNSLSDRWRNIPTRRCTLSHSPFRHAVSAAQQRHSVGLARLITWHESYWEFVDDCQAQNRNQKANNKSGADRGTNRRLGTWCGDTGNVPKIDFWNAQEGWSTC